MKKGRQIIALEYYHNIDVYIEYHRYVNIEFYQVTETPKSGALEKIRLQSTPCSEVEFLKDSPNLIWLKDCLTFDEDIEIGHDRGTSTNKYIQVDVVPCKGDCEVNLADPDYREKI